MYKSRVVFVFLVFPVALTAAAPGEGTLSEETVGSVIQRAGNTDSDRLRLAYLKELAARQQPDSVLRSDLERLITEIDRWLNEPRLAYFGRQARNMDYDFKLSAGSPLEPLTWLYRGRMVTWYARESGGVWHIPERRRRFMAVAREFFEKYSRAFPDNRIARMYLGEPIAAPKHYTAPAGAPAWAVWQREALERLTDIIEWWIDNRMRENGEFGGGWGDDCEMWRWWVPVLIGFDNPKISAAQERFSNAMMKQEHMKAGYTSRMTDVEHTAEDSADVITPMMHLDADSELWKARALRLAELMETLWTDRNDRGFLQYKSTYFTADRVDTNPQRACDTVYHPRAVQPALLYWQRTGDPRLRRLFSAWMDTWVEATARAERGKPAGIIPSAIHWPDGGIGGLGEKWFDPRNHGEYTLYLWPSAMDMMTNTLLLTWHMTGDEKYLAPLRSMARIQLKYLKDPPPAPPAAGSAAWCAQRMSELLPTLAKYRFLTGSTEFDELLERRRTPYMRFRKDHDIDALAAALKHTAEALAVNFPGYTSEVRYTDRVLRFPTLFEGDGIVPVTKAVIHSPDTSLLYSTVTGDPGGALYFPLNAVRWLTPSRNIAAVVTDSGTRRFCAGLYNFDASSRRISAELYLLKKGSYELTLTCDGAKKRKLHGESFTVEGSRSRIAFTLPPRTPCTLTIISR